MSGDLERRLASNDTGEQRRALDALLVAAERFRLVMENVRDFAIVLTDPQGHVVDWNEGMERLFGYRTEEVLGKPFASFFTPEDNQAGMPGRELATAATAGRAEDENWLVRKDGSRFWASGVTTALRDEAGTLRGYVKVVRDLSDRKRVEEALRQRAEELAGESRRKDEFLAMLAHELRNPLAPLRNAMHVLGQKGADPPTVAWAREVAGRQVEHLVRLVEDLLDVSRVHTGKIRLRRERMDLSGLIRATAEDYRPLLHGAGLSLELDCPPEPVWVRGDPTRLAQVVGNLLTNAAKFSNPGGGVTVRLAAEPGVRRAVVSVRDTGIGIEPGVLPDVFGVFTQADRTLDRSRGGLGLGLALARIIH